jgi:hypothetical protein
MDVAPVKRTLYRPTLRRAFSGMSTSSRAHAVSRMAVGAVKRALPPATPLSGRLSGVSNSSRANGVPGIAVAAVKRTIH